MITIITTIISSIRMGMIASAMGKPLEVGVGGGVGDGRTVSVEEQITHS